MLDRCRSIHHGGVEPASGLRHRLSPDAAGGRVRRGDVGWRSATASASREPAHGEHVGAGNALKVVAAGLRCDIYRRLEPCDAP